MSTKPGASDHLYLFIYENLFVDMCSRLNINISLFTYYNGCQHKHVDATTCFCLFMQSCLLKCAFPLNINIYLFTYDNWCKHKQVISFFFSEIASRTEQGIDFNVIYWYLKLLKCILTKLFKYILFIFPHIHFVHLVPIWVKTRCVRMVMKAKRNQVDLLTKTRS